MDSVTEVRYGSVVVGRSPQIRDRTAAGAFVVFSEPLPVGTPIALKIGDEAQGKEQYARVTEVVESADEAAAGMRVRFVDSAERSAAAPKPMARVAPQPAPAAAPAPAPAPAPAAAEPPAPAPEPVAAAPEEQPAAPVPVAAESSTASEAVHSSDTGGHPVDPNAHHDRRRRRRK